MTKMQLHNCIQGSPEWFELKKKYPLSASHAQAIGNNGKGLETLCWEVLSEKYSAIDKEKFSNEHLDRGIELENDARELYMLETGNIVTTVGFVSNTAISEVGGVSPDGLVNEDGLLEIKCFADTKHFKAIVDSKKNGAFLIESDYIWQMQQQLLFTGRKWVDFCIYNPNFHQSLLIQRVLPDLEMQKKIKEGLVKGEAIIKDIEMALIN